MADLLSYPAQRNARFRALAALGSPIRGIWWVTDTAWGGRVAIRLALEVECLACDLGPGRWDHLLSAEACEQPEAQPLRWLETSERALYSAHLLGCPHWPPIGEEDPPEVRELAALELLAGDPPG